MSQSSGWRGLAPGNGIKETYYCRYVAFSIPTDRFILRFGAIKRIIAETHMVFFYMSGFRFYILRPLGQHVYTFFWTSAPLLLTLLKFRFSLRLLLIRLYFHFYLHLLLCLRNRPLVAIRKRLAHGGGAIAYGPRFLRTEASRYSPF